VFSSPVLANEPDPVPLNQGDPAPFTGQLLPTELAIEIGQKAHYADEQIRIAVSKERKIAEVLLDAQRRLVEIERERADQIQAAAEKQANEADSFFKSFEFGLIVGITGGILLILGTGYAMGNLR